MTPTFVKALREEPYQVNVELLEIDGKPCATISAPASASGNGVSIPVWQPGMLASEALASAYEFARGRGLTVFVQDPNDLWQDAWGRLLDYQDWPRKFRHQ